MEMKEESKQTYPVIIHYEDDLYWAEVPDVPSAFTTGKTVEEVVKNIKEAIELALSTTMKVPNPTPFVEVKTHDGIVQLVQVSLKEVPNY